MPTDILVAQSTNGSCIADLVFEIINDDYDAYVRLTDILGTDYLPDDIVHMLLDDPQGIEVRYRLLCLGLSACTILPPDELITFVEKVCQKFTLTEQERKMVKKCYRASGLRKVPLPQ